MASLIFMKVDSSGDTRTGIEVLFDEAIVSAIHVTPTPAKREMLYRLFASIAISPSGPTPGSSSFRGPLVAKFDAKELTAYKNLESAGFVYETDGRALVTPKGLAIHCSFRDEAVYQRLGIAQK